MMKADFFFFFCLFVFRVCGATINAVSFTVIVDVIVADVFAAITTADVDFLAIIIDVNDIGVLATAISADCVFLIFVIDAIVVDVAVVFAIDVVADNFFDIEIIVIIIFVVVDFTVNFHLLAAVDVINVNAVVFSISIYDTTFFLFRCYQSL